MIYWEYLFHVDKCRINILTTKFILLTFIVNNYYFLLIINFVGLCKKLNKTNNMKIAIKHFLTGFFSVLIGFSILFLLISFIVWDIAILKDLCIIRYSLVFSIIGGIMKLINN